MTQNLLKKLHYRSKFRGCKETDILLGNFADSGLTSLSSDELAVYAQFIEEEDGLIYKWLSGQAPVLSKYLELCQKISVYTRP